MDTETARLIYRFSLYAALFSAIAVPIAYQVWSQGEWRRHAWGRHLMSSDSVLAAIFLSIFWIALTDYPLWVDYLIMTSFMVAFTLLRLQRIFYMRRSAESRGYEALPEERTVSG